MQQPQSSAVERHIHNAQQPTPEANILPAADAAADNPEPAQEMSAYETAKAKGDAFENFVVDLLADWRLRLIDRTQDAVSTAGVIAESCKNPDLHVRQKRGNSTIDYYLECKYRSHWDDRAVQFERWQIERYRRFQREKHRKVVIALGVGGTPSGPEILMLVPLDSIKGNTIKQISTRFVVEPSPSSLVEYMNSYFDEVFTAAKLSKKY